MFKHEQFPGEEERETPAGGPEAAEQETGREEELSVEDIKGYTEDLAAKVEAAKQQRAENIERKLSEHEALISEARENDEFLKEAREALEYFSTMEELGELKDKESIQQLKEIQATVASLEDNRVRIEGRIDNIASQPEISGRLEGAAEEEGKEREAQKILEEAREQLEPQIDSLAETIKSLAERERVLLDQTKEHEGVASRAWEEIKGSIGEAVDVIAGTETASKLSGIRRGGEEGATGKELQSGLKEIRGKLGLFKGGEKAAIDSILSGRNAQAFETLTGARNKLNELRAEIESLDEQISGLAEQYKGIILSAWEAENKVSEIGPPPHMSLPSDLSHRINRHVEKFANIRHMEGGKQVGKYNGWHDAMQQVPKNRTLRNIHEVIERKAGGSTLIYRNPKEDAEQ
jgi:hypothetical protein